MNIYKFDSLEDKIQLMVDVLNEKKFFKHLDLDKIKEFLKPYFEKNPNITRLEAILEAEKLITIKEKSKVLQEYF